MNNKLLGVRGGNALHSSRGRGNRRIFAIMLGIYLTGSTEMFSNVLHRHVLGCVCVCKSNDAHFASRLKNRSSDVKLVSLLQNARNCNREHNRTFLNLFSSVFVICTLLLILGLVTFWSCAVFFILELKSGLSSEKDLLTISQMLQVLYLLCHCCEKQYLSKSNI